MLILNNFTFKINHYVNDTIITFNTEQLPVNRHYNVVVDASNAAGSTLSPPFPISMYKDSDFVHKLNSCLQVHMTF